MNTLMILNRAIANARPGGSLQDQQRRAIFARLRGGSSGSTVRRAATGARTTSSGQMAVPAAEALRRARALQAEAQARARVNAGTGSPSEYEDVTGEKWQPRLAVPYGPGRPVPIPYGDDALILRPMSAPTPRAGAAPPRDVRLDRTLLDGLGAALVTVRGTSTVAVVPTRQLRNRLPPTADPQERRRRAYWARMNPGTGARSVSASGMQSMELRTLPTAYIPGVGGEWNLVTLRPPPGSQPAVDSQSAIRAMQGISNILASYRQAFPSDAYGYPTPIVHELEPYFDDPERLRNDPERLAQIEQQLLREIASYTTDNGQRIPPRGYYASMALTHALNLLHSFGRMNMVNGFSRRDGYGAYFSFSANPYDKDLPPYRGLPTPFPYMPISRPGAGGGVSPIPKPGRPPSGPSSIPRPPARGGPYQPPGEPGTIPPPRFYPLSTGSRMQRNRAMSNRLPPTNDPDERRRRAYWARVKGMAAARAASSTRGATRAAPADYGRVTPPRVIGAPEDLRGGPAPLPGAPGPLPAPREHPSPPGTAAPPAVPLRSASASPSAIAQVPTAPGGGVSMAPPQVIAKPRGPGLTPFQQWMLTPGHNTSITPPLAGEAYYTARTIALYDQYRRDHPDDANPPAQWLAVHPEWTPPQVASPPVSPYRPIMMLLATAAGNRSP